MSAERIPQFGAAVYAAARISHRLGYRQQPESTDFTDDTDEKQNNR